MKTGGDNKGHFDDLRLIYLLRLGLGLRLIILKLYKI